MKNFYAKSVMVLLLISIIAISSWGQCNNFSKITTYYYHCLGIKSDGSLWAWGENSYGQLGDGSSTTRNLPVQIGIGWAEIATGGSHSVAIKQDGTMWAWGYNNYGELGNGTHSTAIPGVLSPIQLGTATNWKLVAAGDAHNLAIKSDGTLWAWGRNSEGQVGDGTITQRDAPVQIGTDNNWVAVSCGATFSLAMKSDGTIWSWGSNSFGEMGNGTVSTLGPNVPTQIGTGNTWVKIFAGWFHSVAIKSDGTLWAWGSNTYGQIGIGYTSSTVNTPTQIGTSTNWKTASAGIHHTMALKQDGTYWSWGRNNWAQVDASQVDKSTPTAVTSMNNAALLAAGYNFSLALQSDAALWGWGDNSYGMLGDGTFGSKYFPNKSVTGASYLTLASSNVSSTQYQEVLNFYPNDCNNLICKVAQQAGAPILGNTTAKVWIEGTAPTQFVKRHYEITPVDNAASATGRVTLYFLQSEFDAFNALNTLKLPANPTDNTGIGNIRVEKRSGTSSDNSGLPNTYPGAATTINPGASNIVWNATKSWWEVSFDVTGFSGFWLKTQLAPLFLPVTFGNISAIAKNGILDINFTTLLEKNCDHFDIQLSKDASNWQTIGTVATQNADGNSNTQTIYNFNKNLQEVPAILGLGILALTLLFVKNRSKVRITIIAVLGFVLVSLSCHKSENISATKDTKLFIRVIQVDKDGAKQISKVQQVLFK